MKRMYEKPMAYEEIFVAYNYCTSACYKLACTVGPGKPNGSNGKYWKQDEKGGVTHSPAGTKGTCADESANRVITGNGGLYTGTQVGEYNKDQGWINGGIDTIIDVNGNGIADTGDIIYWHTNSSSGDWGRWNHVGTIGEADTSHPNHS